MEGGDQSCIECEMESVAWVKVVGLAVGLVVACLLLVVAYLCYQKMAARGAKKDAGTLRSAPRALSSLYGTIAASAAHEWLKQIPLNPKIPLKPNGHFDHSMCRWVKPNFVSGGAVPLSIYGKVRNSSAT